MDNENKNENKKICELCDGIGLIKNKNLYCVKCDASRCDYTKNMCKEEFYKYKFCEFCIGFDLDNNLNTHNSSPKTHCLKCLGEGYYLNSGIVCNYCEIPHLVCDCGINPFDECPNCYGSGTHK